MRLILLTHTSTRSLLFVLYWFVNEREMEGYLGKKGKRMGSRVKRFMRLEGVVLSNHQDVDSPPSWKVNIKDAVISCNAKRAKLVIELFNNKLELYADTSKECLEWYDALKTAKRKSNAEGNKENISTNMQRRSNSGGEALAMKCSNTLGDKFKVVKPTSKYVGSDDSSDESCENNVPRPTILTENGQSQAYEETPASMIFKQFTFPTKSMQL